MAGNATVVRQLRAVGRVAAELGVTVVEAAGWTTRGRSDDLIITALLCHHTAATVDVDRLLRDGYGSLPGPLCNIALHADGTLVLMASGRANHAGVGTLPNNRSAGLEATGPIPLSNTGPDAFPNYGAYVKVAAAFCVVFGWPADRAHVPGHKETALPEGRKVDPAFDMGRFRVRVADTVARYRSGGQQGDLSMAEAQDVLDAIAALRRDLTVFGTRGLEETVEAFATRQRDTLAKLDAALNQVGALAVRVDALATGAATAPVTLTDEQLAQVVAELRSGLAQPVGAHLAALMANGLRAGADQLTQSGGLT